MDAMDHGKHKVARRTNRSKKDSPCIKKKKKKRKKRSSELAGQLVYLSDRLTQIDQDLSALQEEKKQLRFQLSDISFALQKLQRTGSDAYDADTEVGLQGSSESSSS